MKTNWEKFDARTYIGNNYSSIHSEDREIINRLVTFYSSLSSVMSALEVGVGPNLYPIMAMLPYIKKIECIDFSKSNLIYLRKQLKKPDDNWYKFWELFRSLSQEYNIDLVENLEKKVKTKHGSIYELEEKKYDLASMFFCAESITREHNEFVLACNKFIKSVKSGGNLVAVFMENSKGYSINNIDFPAYPVDIDLIKKIFQPKTSSLLVVRIPLARQPLRPGYIGMLLLTAVVKNLKD